MFKKIADYLYLRKSGVVFDSLVTFENRSNIKLGSNITIGANVKIRSRCNEAAIKIGHSTKIREFVEINAKGGIVDIKDNSFIAKNSWIGGSGEISIGPNTMIGISSIIVSSDHDYKSIQVPYYETSEIPKPIFIGQNVWVGAGSIILGGSTIGHGSVVAAGSVVMGDFPEDSFIVGVPAKVKHTITSQRWGHSLTI